jgi:hypothetical protein
VDEALYETSSRSNPREILDIYGESSLEARNNGDFNEQGSYFIKTPSNPCSYEISLDSLSLSLTTPHKIFNLLMLLVPKNFERVAINAYVYHRYCRSRCVKS